MSLYWTRRRETLGTQRALHVQRLQGAEEVARRKPPLTPHYIKNLMTFCFDRIADGG